MTQQMHDQLMNEIRKQTLLLGQIVTLLREESQPVTTTQEKPPIKLPNALIETVDTAARPGQPVRPPNPEPAPKGRRK